ncbi:MAG: AEC family transporter [Lentisphaerae bacterium]|nr:AEC family transporter [Lentisphaerota bacterium]
MFLYILNTLAPICLLVTTGYLLRKFSFAPLSFFQNLNRLVYWVGLPAMLLETTARTEISGTEPLQMCSLLATVTFICLILGYIIAWCNGVKGCSGPIVQGSFRGNLVYIGLPIVIFSLSDQTPERAASLAACAVLSVAPIVPLYNALAVIVLVAGNEETPRGSIGKTLLKVIPKIATNPLLLACLGGLTLSWLKLPLPPLIQRTLSATGQMALPLSLVAIGAVLSFRSLKQNWRPVTVASIVKAFGAPAIGYLLGVTIFGLSGAALRSTLIFAATPTAVASYIMTDQLGGDADMSARIIILTTILALPGLALVLALV